MNDGLDSLMKQAQQMQRRMERLRAEMTKSEVIGESGAGLVKITMSGSHDVKSVKIDPALYSEEKVVLEEMVAAAFNDAVRRVEEHQKSQLSELTGGIPLPSGMKLPF